MAQFQVDSDQVIAANAQITATITRLQSEVQNLHNQLQSLQGSWRGAAAESFQALANRWRTTAGAVDAQLAEIGTALALAGAQYRDIEYANQRLFLG
ncbi:MAG: WXG100 family type VII secretion target [Actinomycetota bacterium]